MKSTEALSEPDMLNETEAATLATVSVANLRARRQSGEQPPFVRLGRLVRYRRADLPAWIAASVVEPEARP